MKFQDLSRRFLVRELCEEDVDAVYALCAGNPQFYRYHPPFVTRESIREDMRALPPGTTLEAKAFLGFFDSKELVAVLDLISGYPDARTAFIGLFIVDASRQGQGLGSEIIRECAECLRLAGYAKIRLAIDKGNPQSEAFWTKNRFVKTGEEYPHTLYTHVPLELLL